MKKFLPLIILSMVLSSFTGRPVDEDVKEIRGYKLANHNFSLTDYNLWVVTNKEVFCDIFLPAGNSPMYPDFDAEWVVAGKVKTVHHAYTLVFKRSVAGKEELNVYFKLKKDKYAQETDDSVSMIAVPRNSQVKRVNFYHDEVLVKSIPIVTVF
ncbi:MAG: hypothetical protein NTW29_03220 [Bacteroidetes bacterium]|nr:hypothetical protein [Bacteroidota bacterium]